MIDPDLKKRWLEALESGEYKKARGVLRNPRTGGRCCLGVLAGLEGYSDLALDDVVAIFPLGHFIDDYSFCGMSREELQHLATLNDRKGGFPVEAIRALKESPNGS